MAPADPVKPAEVGPSVQSRHANVASPKIATVIPDVPQVIRMPSVAAPLAPTQPASARTIIVAPAERGHASVPTPTLSAVAPQGGVPSVGTAVADPAPIAAEPRQVVAIAPPAENAHANAPPRKLGGAPEGSDAPRTPAPAERAVPRRLAALPPASVPGKATDAPPISVLRGGPRYAQSGRPQAAAIPAITVIRGGRPRPGMQGFVQPGPLILRIPD